MKQKQALKKAARKIQRVKDAIFKQNPLYGSAVDEMKLVPCDIVADMWAKGETILYNPAYVYGCTQEEIRKILNVMVRHILVERRYALYKKKQPTMWQKLIKFIRRNK